MELVCCFNDKHHFRAPGGIGETHFVSIQRPDSAHDNVTLSPYDGVPDGVHSISVLCMGLERSPNLSFAALKSLLDNTPRKLDNFRMGFLRPVALSPEYLGFFVSMCNKSKRLRLDMNGLSHPAQLDCLATCLTQKDGIKELELDLSFFDFSSLQHLRQFFQSIAASPCLEKIRCFGVDLTGENLGMELMEALQATEITPLKTLELHADWGHDIMMFERFFCAIVDQTQLEDLRLFSGIPTSTRNTNRQDGGDFDEIRSRFFETLASAKNLKNLELCRDLLPGSDDSYLASFEDAISRNTCLERLILRHYNGEKHDIEWQRRYNKLLRVPTV